MKFSVTESDLLDDECGRDFITFKLDGDTDALWKIEGLDLYNLPLNPGSRGGKRFIAHSATLGKALTIAFKDYRIRNLIGDQFSHVNPIFRFNSFSPTDTGFNSHFDTPYYDSTRKHISRFTLLIYLTGGTADPVLDVAGMTLSKVERSELIYNIGKDQVEHDPGIGALFSTACYMTSESIFHPQLASYTHKCYDRVAQAHWKPGTGDGKETVFLHKLFRGIHFVANGYDFWFAKGIDLKYCAVITLLDYFNCQINGIAFKKQCTSNPISKKTESGIDWIPPFLQKAQLSSTDSLKFKKITAARKSSMMPTLPEMDGTMCCDTHSRGKFEPEMCDDTCEIFYQSCYDAKKSLLRAPILLLGDLIKIDVDRILVHGQKIYINESSDTKLPPVNFASCWNSGQSPHDYIDLDGGYDAPEFNIPPILFQQTDDTIHLIFDFFRNDWMVKVSPRMIPIPKFCDPTKSS
eukprot:TRINITY_DN4529_c0_g1_i1.p1 TRINITY_DN4529_c0_g1~~TRINITY_DN4529_c0_g1_i1.p1  ORF type:complete len:464 (-),score=57.42 TRINITY_DN4529_c0_g1_i1:17-1408(-)